MSLVAAWILVGFCFFLLSACGVDSSYTVTDLNPGCEATTITWTDGSGLAICEADIDAGEADEQALLQDTDLPAIGSVGVECVDSNWAIEDDSEQCATAPSGLRQIAISLRADGTSRFFEYFSDSFAQIDKGFNGSDVLDGFYKISELPDFVQIGGGYDMFPAEGDWVDILDVTYDTDGLSGIGDELAPVTEVVTELNDVIPGEGTTLMRPYTTEFSNSSGTVSLRDGEVVAIPEIQATVTFLFDTADLAGAFGIGDTIEATGDLMIESSGRFSLYAATEDVLDNDDIGEPDVKWDLTGQVNPDSFE
jgi:hypothetical protein